jgi:predicted TIM-barrel fold metal-dependent hydrolase
LIECLGLREPETRRKNSVTDNPGYELISADSHVVEPPDIFEKRLPKSMQDRAPKLKDWNGGSAWFVDGIDQPVPFLASTVTGSGYRKPRQAKDTAVGFDQVMTALYDPVERIKAQDADSVSAEVLYGYPYLWDALKLSDDLEVRLACARAYNDWLAEFCAQDPNRLIGVAKIPTSSIKEARDELARCVEELNLRGAVLDAFPADATGPTDTNLDAIWEIAHQARIPVSLHYGLGDARSAPTAGITAGQKPPAANSALPLVGAFDRFPELKMVFSHTDAGWSFFWLEFFDNTYLRQRHLDLFKMPDPETFPSVYLRRHFWWTIQKDTAAIKHRDLFGADHLMWASHFPLDASNWPDNRQSAVQLVDELPEADRRAFLVDNVARLYRLPGYEDGISPRPFEELEKLVHI